MNPIQSLQAALSSHRVNIAAIDRCVLGLAAESDSLKKYEQTLLESYTPENVSTIEMHQRWVQSSLDRLGRQFEGCKVQREWHIEGARRTNEKIVRLEREIQTALVSTMVEVQGRKMEKGKKRRYVAKGEKRSSQSQQQPRKDKDNQRRKHGKAA